MPFNDRGAGRCEEEDRCVFLHAISRHQIVRAKHRRSEQPNIHRKVGQKYRILRSSIAGFRAQTAGGAKVWTQPCHLRQNCGGFVFRRRFLLAQLRFSFDRQDCNVLPADHVLQVPQLFVWHWFLSDIDQDCATQNPMARIIRSSAPLAEDWHTRIILSLRSRPWPPAHHTFLCRNMAPCTGQLYLKLARQQLLLAVNQLSHCIAETERSPYFLR